MKKLLRHIWSPADTAELVEHARKWAGLHTIQAYTCPPPADDELEFERDMAYLRDLQAAIHVELIGTDQRIPEPDETTWLDSWWQLDTLRDDSLWQIEVAA